MDLAVVMRLSNRIERLLADQMQPVYGGIPDHPPMVFSNAKMMDRELKCPAS
jgi:hypothetical protein